MTERSTNEKVPSRTLIFDYVEWFQGNPKRSNYDFIATSKVKNVIAEKIP